MLTSNLSREQCNDLYDEVLGDQDALAARELCLTDLFFLLTRGFRRKDIDRPWLFDRSREVQASPDGQLDLWAREHYKSTIITFGKSIQDVLDDPDNTTVGIFSHTRPIAKGFLDQIKRELEGNQFLKDLFPDVLYADPKSEAPKWSLDSGLIIKRLTNPKEASFEAWGLVDGQPTSKHFSILNYDDVVTRDSVTTPEQIKKTTEALEHSYNLGASGGRRRLIGTRYHANDSYKVIIERGTAIARIKPATHNGKMDGDPVFLSREELNIKRRDQGPYTFSCQMLQDPVSDRAMSFRDEWLHFYEKLADTKGWNKYILVDPAGKKGMSNDFTVMKVIGLAPDNNYYLLDAIRDRLNLTERARKLFDLHRKHSPRAVGYEQYGLAADIEHIKYEMEQQNYRFNIIELKGSVKKEDRILKLVPVFEQGRFYMPKKLIFIDNEKQIKDYVQIFIENEYQAFPVCTHDDMLDCLARILDPSLNAIFPKIVKPQQTVQSVSTNSGHGWMG